MTSVHYKRLFSLRIGHNYYQDGQARGIHLVPSPDTVALLKRGRMLFRQSAGVYVVLYRADGSVPLVDLGFEARFRFLLVVNNPAELLNISNLDESGGPAYQSGNRLYFTNSPGSASTSPDSPEEITHKLVSAVFPDLFTYTFEVTGNPAQVQLQVLDESGTPVSAGNDALGNPLPVSLPVNRNDNNQYTQSIDIRRKVKGLYTFRVRDAGGSTILQDTPVIIDGNLAGSTFLGAVDIRYESPSNHLYGSQEHYQVTLIRKETRWKYFVVNKNNKIDLSAVDLQVQDTSSGGGTPYSSYTFNRVGNEPNADVRINGKDTVIFQSTATIPFYELPKRNLELRSTPGNQQIILNLPNPSQQGVSKEEAGNTISEIYVFV